MIKDIDTRNFPTTESYVGYGKTDLSKMTVGELKDELKKVTHDIEENQSELNESEDVPSFVLKEKIDNNLHYKGKIIDELSSRDEEKENNALDDMIKQLDRQLDKGTITQEYHDKYVAKLESRRDTYNESLRKEKEKIKREQEKKDKRHVFKRFKAKLSDYKKK